MNTVLLPQDTLLDSFRRIVFSKVIKARVVIKARRKDARMLSAKVQLIAPLLHRSQKLPPCHAAHNSRIHIFADGSTPCGLAVPLCLPLGVLSALTLGMRNNGKTVSVTNFVGYFSQQSIGRFIVTIAFAVQEGYGVQYKMIVKMSCVQMCGNDDFKPPAPEPICELNAHTVRRFSIDLICRKALIGMKGLNAAALTVAFLCELHLAKGSLRKAVDARYIKPLLRLAAVCCIVQNIVQGGLLWIVPIGIERFLRVAGIVDDTP